MIALVGTVAYKLDFPAEMKIHPVFYVSQLGAFNDPDQVFTGRQQHPPPPTVTHTGVEHTVECILGNRLHGGKLQYYVRWTGNGAEVIPTSTHQI